MMKLREVTTGDDVMLSENREDGPLIKGSMGPESFECPQCGRVLIEGINPHQVRNIVCRRPSCGTLSEIPTGEP